jgi:EpsI family protein
MENEKQKSILSSRYARILTGALLVQAALFYTASHGDAVPLRQPLEQFPKTLGAWHTLHVGIVDKDTLEVLKADDTMSRDYVSPGGLVNLWVAYFKTQRTGSSPHSPKNCLPGAGWSQVSAGDLNVQIPSTGETIRINRYEVSKDQDKSLTLYWYQSERRVVANEFDAKFWLVADSMRLHRSDTSVVKIVVPIFKDHEQEAQDLGVSFVKVVYPALRQFLPS